MTSRLPTKLNRLGLLNDEATDDGRGVALVDWDQDGDLDLWISNRSAPRVRFLRNNIAHQNHFLAV